MKTRNSAIANRSRVSYADKVTTVHGWHRC